MNARALAISILARVETTDAYLNVVLDQKLAEEVSLDRRDAALITELCYGATRRRMLLDHVLAKLSDRPLEKLEDRVLAALRLGAYQVYFTRVPARAAVGETVEALKTLGLSRATGFCNAILRKLSASSEPPLPDETDVARYLAVKESHPEWLIRRWLERYGPERTHSMLQANNEAPSVVVRTNTRKTSREALLSELREMGVHAEPTASSPVGIVLPKAGRVEELYGYAEGLWQVQDEAAQLVGLLATVPEGSRVLDACAAPGGKACHLAERYEVVAIDLHANKLRKIESEARRLGVLDRMTVKSQDARVVPESLGDFDAVLVDAPCTGLGTLRRHPEIRYRRSAEDVSELAKLQREILDSCQARVKPGGLLIYAVCSTEPEEGAQQMTDFVRTNSEFQPMGRDLVTLPGPEGMDGFFARRLTLRRTPTP